MALIVSKNKNVLTLKNPNRIIIQHDEKEQTNAPDMVKTWRKSWTKQRCVLKYKMQAVYNTITVKNFF